MTLHEDLAREIGTPDNPISPNYAAARILKRFVVIPKTDLPQAVVKGSIVSAVSGSYGAADNIKTPEDFRREALIYLAMAEAVETHNADEDRRARDEAEKELWTRRNEAVREVTERAGTQTIPYKEAGLLVRAAVDLLIEARNK